MKQHLHIYPLHVSGLITLMVNLAKKGDVHLKFSGHTIALLRNLMSNLGQILHVKRFFVTETGPAKVEVIRPL